MNQKVLHRNGKFDTIHFFKKDWYDGMEMIYLVRMEGEISHGRTILAMD